MHPITICNMLCHLRLCLLHMLWRWAPGNVVIFVVDTSFICSTRIFFDLIDSSVFRTCMKSSFLPLFSLPYLLTPSCIYFVYWVSPKILMDKYDSWYKLFSSRDILLKCCRWWWRYRWLAKWRCGNYMLPSGNDNSLRF